MTVTSNIPKWVWAIVAVPTAVLILSISWLIVTYACVIKSAKESTISTPWLTITSKVNTLDNNVQDIIAKYNQLLDTNTQLIEQLNKIKTASISSASGGGASKQNNIAPELSSLIHNLKQQSSLLLEQKNKLQGVSAELQNVKHQYQLLK